MNYYRIGGKDTTSKAGWWDMIIASETQVKAKTIAAGALINSGRHDLILGMSVEKIEDPVILFSTVEKGIEKNEIEYISPGQTDRM